MLTKKNSRELNPLARSLEQFYRHAPLRNPDSNRITQQSLKVIRPFMTQDEIFDLDYEVIMNPDRTKFDKVMLKVYRRLKKLKEFK